MGFAPVTAINRNSGLVSHTMQKPTTSTGPLRRPNNIPGSNPNRWLFQPPNVGLILTCKVQMIRATQIASGLPKEP
jgi:hypothetical protein